MRWWTGYLQLKWVFLCWASGHSWRDNMRSWDVWGTTTTSNLKEPCDFEGSWARGLYSVFQSGKWKALFFEWSKVYKALHFPSLILVSAVDGEVGQLFREEPRKNWAICIHMDRKLSFYLCSRTLGPGWSPSAWAPSATLIDCSFKNKEGHYSSWHLLQLLITKLCTHLFDNQTLCHSPSPATLRSIKDT